MTPDTPISGGAALRVYNGYRYTIITFINGGGKPPTAQAELWWQRESDTPLARWTYFRRQTAAGPRLRAGWRLTFSSGLQGKSKPEIRARSIRLTDV
jgi:hypothetical protein